MRYWHPRSDEVARMIKKYDPSEIIMLPLYPQFSSTTTGSSINDFLMALKDNHLQDKNIRTIGCYPIDQKFIEAHTALILENISRIKNKDNFRILFSAHGLPVKIIKAGDPYQWQVEKSVENIVKKLGINNLDYKITYQSRVGPVEWLKPNTDEEIESAGKEGKGLIIVPIAFVSEHVETLVELDIEYKHLAEKYGIEYIRVPTLSLNEKFIEFLRDLICKEEDVRTRICPKELGLCGCRVIAEKEPGHG
jgi:ferrochelatase